MGLISQFMNSWLFLPSLLIATAVASVLFFKEFIDPQPETMDETALEEIVRGDVEDLIGLFGSDVHKKISYGITPIGKVDKAWGYKEYKALKESENYDPESDKYVKQDGEEFKLDDNYFYFKIRPVGFITNLIADLIDGVLNFQKYTKYVVVEKDFVSDGEVLTIKDEWNPTKMGGVWLPDSQAGAEFVKDKTFKSIFEDTMETAKNAVKATNELNLKFTQDIQKLEKEEELLQKRYGAKGAGMVNESS